MMNVIIAVGVLFIVGLAWFFFRERPLNPAGGSGDKTKQTLPASTSPGVELRQMVLSAPPQKLDATSGNKFPHVYGVLMDWHIDTNVATVFASSTGDASLYTTSTFGIIGGIGHESVRNVAIKFVLAAESLYDGASPTKAFPYPDGSRIKFYLLTYEGVRVIDTDLASVMSGSSKYSEVANLGQDVLTELRLVSEGGSKSSTR